MRTHDLVFLHGQPGAAADWHAVVALLPPGVNAHAFDRPGYGSNPDAAAGFADNARAVLDDLDARGVERAVIVAHSFGGGVALEIAARAPHRVEAVVLLASVGPECLNGWDTLLAAPIAGPICSILAFKMTPWFARLRLAVARRRRGRPRRPHEHVNWHVWADTRWSHGPVWRSFLIEQRALVREIDHVVARAQSIGSRVLLLADPKDGIVPFATSRLLADALPDARLELVHDAGHHLPLRASARVAHLLTVFLGELDAGDSDSDAGQGEDAGGARAARRPA